MKSIIIFAVVILVLVVGGFYIFSGTDSEVIENNEVLSGGELKEFDMIARQWEFSPGIIEVSLGDRVKLNIESVDVAHGIRLSEFGVDQRITPGQTSTVEFIADKEGTFPFACSVSCGVGHGSMRGTLIVK